MRKLIGGTVAVLALAFAPTALGHPSENRAEQGFFFGPHCHTNQQSDKLAVPSHRAHIATGLDGRIFVALQECPPD
jgi:hypothetical protein